MTLKHKLLFFAVACYILTFSISLYLNIDNDKPQSFTDISRLSTEKIHKIITVNTDDDIRAAINEAKLEGRNISVAGKGHSQGGQTFCRGCIVLDMKQYNRILSLNTMEKTIRVQSGATWDQIQDAINEHHLAVRVMQSSNIFTVGGSLGSNVHGRDPREGPLIDTLQTIRIMTADGSIVNASPTENRELFQLAIGGYGLFGVILDAELKLTDNTMYEEEVVFTDYMKFPDYFKSQVLKESGVELVIARLSVAPTSFLTEMYVTNYRRTDRAPERHAVPLQGETNIERDKFIFGLSRKFDWGKDLSWKLQKRIYSSDDRVLITRNNAMRPGIEFLDYYSSQKTDILQEYFVPVDRFESFVDGLRDIMKESDSNLFNITVRYMPRNRDAFLSYATNDSLALVLLFNHQLSKTGIEKMESVTRRIVDLALTHNGTYYLTYQLFPTKMQLKAAYPNIDEFFAKKKEYDPNEIFQNQFYVRYGQHDS